jgi:uncharacterized protein YggE
VYRKFKEKKKIMNRSIRLSVVASACLVALLMLLVAPAAQPVQAQTPATARTITVLGTGTSYTAPDIAYLYVGVDIQNADLSAAMKEADTRMNAVLAALKKAEIADADIQTVNYNIYREQQFGPQGGTTGDSIYHVNNIIRVAVRDTTKVGDILSAAVTAGANVVNNVEFSVENTKTNETSARKLALDDAKSRATELATSIGATLGKIVSVQEGTMFGNPIAEAAYGKGGGGGGGPTLIGGSLQVTITLTVTYEIQ